MIRILRWFCCFLILSVMGFSAWFFHSYALLSAMAGIVLFMAASIAFFYVFVNRINVNLEITALRINKDDEAILTVRINNASLYPFSNARGVITIHNLFYKPEEIQLKTAVPAFIGKKIRLNMVCNHCGLIRVSTDKLLVSDMLGLVNKSITAEACISTSVMPEIQAVEVPSKISVSTDIEADSESVRSNEGDPAGTREYIYGDRLNSINWKLSARADKLMVKDFEHTVGDEYIFLADTCRRLIEKTVTRLYSLCCAVIDRGERVYVVWQSMGSEQLSLRYVTSRSELDEVLDEIYMSHLQSTEKAALYTYRQLNSEAEVIYVGDSVERM